MATAYYYAAHFNSNMAHTIPNQTINDKSTHPMFDMQTYAPQHPTAPTKLNGNVPATRRIFFATGTMSQQKDSMFFRLPAELRNQIYEDLLCPNTAQPKDLTHDTKTPTKGQAPLYPAILSTCRRIHEEATDLLYTTHIFHAHPSLLTSLPHLTSAAKPVLYAEGIEKISRWQLTLRLDTDPRFTMQQATSAFSGAEYLEIRAWQSMFDGCDYSVLKLLTGIRGVHIARVCGSVNAELARWLEERMMQPVEKEKVDLCHCVDEMREMRCGRCCKRIEGGGWFEERDAWRFGNR